MLLDLHSFTAPGVPFVFMGPANNAGPIEPFDRAAREEALAQRLGVGRAVDGWLTTYAGGVARRQAHAAKFPEATLDLDPRYGVGTTEYMRSIGGSALTLECGQHEDPAAPDVAYRAIVNTLAHLRLTDAPDPPPARMECLSLCEVIDRLHPDDAFARGLAQLRPGGRGPGDRHPARRQRHRRAVRRLHRLPESDRRAGARVVLSRAVEHAARIGAGAGFPVGVTLDSIRPGRTAESSRHEPRTTPETAP